MKYITLFEDYSDAELKDLMGDLGGVGLQKKWRVIGRIYTVTPDREYYKNWEVQTHQVFIADVIAEKKEDAYRGVFDKLKSGDFTQDLSGYDGLYGIFHIIPEVKRILSKKNIIKCANGKANAQTEETVNLSGESIKYGKTRWILTVDLLGPTEEATIEYLQNKNQLSPEIEDWVSQRVGWNLSAEEI
jgi:hypothetical protein